MGGELDAGEGLDGAARGRHAGDGLELGEQFSRRGRHLVDGPLERGVGLGRPGLHPAHLANVLAGGGLNLGDGGGRFQPPEGSDVAAHAPRLGPVATTTGVDRHP